MSNGSATHSVIAHAVAVSMSFLSAYQIIVVSASHESVVRGPAVLFFLRDSAVPYEIAVSGISVAWGEEMSSDEQNGWCKTYG